MKTALIVTAGGKGLRFGGQTRKQYVEVLQKPLLIWTLKPFLDSKLFNEIILTLPSEDILSVSELLSNHHLKNIRLIPGGENRQDSVFNGLSACQPDTDFVMIHDAVRPLIYLEDINKLLELVQIHQAVIPAKKVSNTIKLMKNNFIENTIDRSHLVEVYTPQTFSFPLILKAHQSIRQSGLEFTDDAGIMEYQNFPVYLYQISNINFKLTYQEDLLILETLLKKIYHKEVLNES